MRQLPKIFPSILAGIFISLGAAVATSVSYAVSNPSISKLISGIVFPVGLIMVILLGCDLFTGKCLMISESISKKLSWKDTGLVLTIAYIGNFLGAVLTAVLVYSSGNLDRTSDAYLSIAQYKNSLDSLQLVTSGILCNILVCAAVLMSAKCESVVSKVAVIFFPILTFVACGFEHSVADMYYLTIGALCGADFQISTLLLVTLGNIVGGAGLGLIVKSCK